VVLEALPFGLALADAAGRLLAGNREFRDLLIGRPEGAAGTCCDLFGCHQGSGALAHRCVTRATLTGGALSDVPVEIVSAGSGRTAFLSTSRAEAGGGAVLLQVRITQPRPDVGLPGFHGRPFEMFTLGRTHLQDAGGSRDGSWLEQRPAQLFKFLIGERNRIVPVEEIAEALWSNARPQTLAHVRQCVYAVRDRLEPDRAPRARSSVIVAHRGGYRVNLDLIWVDADHFEALATQGASLYRAGDHSLARTQIGRAMDLYRGHFFEDEPYAEWALQERNRLIAIASNSLRMLAAIEMRARDYDAAAAALERLSRIDGYDMHVERELIALCMLRGRRSEARRRYTALRSRLLRGLGEEPDFDLTDIGVSDTGIEERLLA